MEEPTLIEKIAESLGNTVMYMNEIQAELTSLKEEVKGLREEVKKSNELGNNCKDCLEQIMQEKEKSTNK